MKKILSLLLALTMLLGVAGMASAAEVSATGEYPIVENYGDVKLSYLVVDHPAILDWPTNEFILWMNEQTNVELEFETVASDGKTEKLNLIFAAGQIPDALIGVNVSDGAVMRYGMDEGLFMPLNDLIDEHGYYVNEMFEQYPDAKKRVTMMDGNIYSLPGINDCFHVYMPQRYWINQKWLDNLGLEMPTTTDEFYDVLVAFRDQDANGNGDPNDEVPLAGAINGWYSNPDWFLMNAFCYYNIANMRDYNNEMGLFLDGDTVTHSFDDPAFKEGLAYLNKLFSEDLLYNASYNQTFDQMQQLAENPDANLLGCASAGWVQFATIGGERYGEYEAVPPLVGPSGYQNVAADPYVPYSIGQVIINKDCEYPEVVMKWADLCYSEEGTLRSYFGPYGEAWEWAQEGDIGLDGNPAVYRQLIPWQETEPQSLHTVQQIPDFRSSRIRLGLADDTTKDIKSADRLETWLQAVAEEYWQYATPEKKLPPVLYTVEENDARMVASTEVGSYLKESITGFINGTLDIENDYDKFRAELDAKGLPLLQEYAQKAYDAQWKD